MPFMKYEGNKIIVGEFESVLNCMDFGNNGYIAGPLFKGRVQMKVREFTKAQQKEADKYMEQLHIENALEESHRAKWFNKGSPPMVARKGIGTA